MPDRFLDQSTTYPAYAATPTWGVAQDGDGVSSGVATPATCSVVFTGIPSSGVIAVLGITVAPTWATSADVCANNLATTINATATVATSPAGITRKSQVRNHVWARGPAGGAPAGTCQIMMRQGTAAVNGQVAVTHTLNNVSSAGTVTWAGGASGAWAYLCNVGGTIWPQAIALAQYGLWGANLPFCGDLLPGDRVLIRARNHSIATTAGAIPLNFAAQGTLADPISYQLDTGATWGDSATATLFFGVNNPNGQNIDTTSASGSAFLRIVGGSLAGGAKRLRIGYSGSVGGSGFNWLWRASSDMALVGVEMVQLLTGDNVGMQLRDQSNATVRFIDCLFAFRSSSVLISASFGSGSRMVFEGGEIRNASLDGVVGGAVHAGLVGGSSSLELASFHGTRFTQFVTGSRLAVEGVQASVHAVDCAMGGITVRGPCVHTSAYLNNWRTRQVVFQSQQGARDWSIDTTLGIAEWNSSRSFPVRAGLQFDGVSKWSIRFCASTTTGTSPGRPWVLPRISKVNSLSTGSRTVSAHFILEKTLAWTDQDIHIRVHYLNSAGVPTVVYSRSEAPAALIPDEAGAWNQYGSGGDALNVTWENLGTIFHKQYRATVVCPDMLTGSEIGVHLVITRSVATANLGGFLDPEITIA